MEKLNVLRVPIDKLHPDPGNVRKHGEKNLTAIKASLLRFGQQKPIVIDAKNIVRAGNGTLEAAKTLGWSHIDCVMSDLVGSELAAFAIADNRTAELAEWDQDGLAKQLLALEQEGFGLDDLGFHAFEPNISEDDLDKNEKPLDAENLKLVVECDNIDDLDDLFRELNDRGFRVKR